MPDRVRWAVDMIGRQSAQLERLIKDLVDVARITNGHIQLHRTPSPFRVALTGYSQDDDRKSARDAGFDHHLLKPPDPKEIEVLLAGLGDSDSSA